MLSMIRKFTRYRQAHGLGAALRASARKLLTGRADTAPAHEALPPESAGSTPVPGGLLQARTDLIGFYGGILGHPHGSAEALATADPGTDTLQWVIPSFGAGSGGHLNIFRFINNLADLGYRQRLVILPPHNWRSAGQAAAAMAEWYFPVKADIALDLNGFQPAHATIATGWQTAYWVAQFHSTREKFYFVQDFEPAFYPASSEYLFAENTYRLGLKGITAGSWLSEKLSREYGMTTGAVSFSCDMDFYAPQAASRDKRDRVNILFYSRHTTKRRLFELGLCALDIVARENPEVNVIFAGGDVRGFRVPFRHVNAGELPLTALPDLYADCDLALCLSGTNLSLLPLELAACKVPVVMNDTPSARWLLPEEAAFYAPADPAGMAETLTHAVRDPGARQARAEAAFAFAKTTSWQEEARKMARLLEEL